MKKVTPAKVGIYTVLTFWSTTFCSPWVMMASSSMSTTMMVTATETSRHDRRSGPAPPGGSAAPAPGGGGPQQLPGAPGPGLHITNGSPRENGGLSLTSPCHSGGSAIPRRRPPPAFSMLAGLKGEFPRMQIAVLTGYRDFEYAQRAIRLGVARFLLKPSRMDELNEALAHMTG